MSRYTLAVLFWLLLLIMVPPTVKATKSECYNGLVTIEVEAPDEVKPEEEFQIYFKIYSTSHDVYITSARVELWAMGNYKKATLLRSFSLTKRSIIRKNITFLLKPALPYPNLVHCDLWLLCGEEGSEYHFSHCRFVVSRCVSSTYDELTAEYNRLNESYNELEERHKVLINELNDTKTSLYIFIALTIILTATTSYFAKTKVNRKKEYRTFSCPEERP